MARKDISNGARTAFLDEHKGWTIEVATGWDCVSDRWPVHVYVTPPDRERYEVPVFEPIRTSEEDALEHGFETGRWHVEHEAD